MYIIPENHHMCATDRCTKQKELYLQVCGGGGGGGGAAHQRRCEDPDPDETNTRMNMVMTNNTNPAIVSESFLTYGRKSSQ
jgi:hypothetical protein